MGSGTTLWARSGPRTSACWRWRRLPSLTGQCASATGWRSSPTSHTTSTGSGQPGCCCCSVVFSPPGRRVANTIHPCDVVLVSQLTLDVLTGCPHWLLTLVLQNVLGYNCVTSNPVSLNGVWAAGDESYTTCTSTGSQKPQRGLNYT